MKPKKLNKEIQRQIDSATKAMKLQQIELDLVKGCVRTILPLIPDTADSDTTVQIAKKVLEGFAK